MTTEVLRSGQVGAHARFRLAVSSTLILTGLSATVAGALGMSAMALKPHAHFAPVPMRACRADYASSGTGRPYPPVPRWRATAIPGDLTDRVAVYTDPRQYVDVVGPAGWNCIASFGNGPLDFTIFKPGQPTPGYYFIQGKHPSGLSGINVLGYTGSSISSLLQTFPYFRLPRVELYKENPWVRSSMCRIPVGEVVLPSSRSLDVVDDPPHVVGGDQPSGGALWALGNVHQGDTAWGSYQFTCTLPATMHAVCYASLAWFDRHWH